MSNYNSPKKSKIISFPQEYEEGREEEIVKQFKEVDIEEPQYFSYKMTLQESLKRKHRKDRKDHKKKKRQSKLIPLKDVINESKAKKHQKLKSFRISM